VAPAAVDEHRCQGRQEIRGYRPRRGLIGTRQDAGDETELVVEVVQSRSPAKGQFP
jgi:hypothetical protein